MLPESEFEVVRSKAFELFEELPIKRESFLDFKSWVVSPEILGLLIILVKEILILQPELLVEFLLFLFSLFDESENALYLLVFIAFVNEGFSELVLLIIVC